MIKDSLTQFELCQKHNLPRDVFIKPDNSSSLQKQVCRQCADQFYGIVSAQQVKDQNQVLIQIFESQAKFNSIQMNLLIHSLIQIREMLDKKIESLINETRSQIQHQEDLLKQSKENILHQPTIKQNQEKYITKLKLFQNYAIQEIELLQKNINFISNVKLLKEMDLSELNEQLPLKKVKIEQSSIQGQIIFVDNQKKFKQFEYQLLNTINQDESIYGIAFNKDATFVAITFGKSVKLFQFQNEQLQEIKKIDQDSNIFEIQFMKKSNQLILKSDGSIRIWKQQNDQQWICTNDSCIQGKLVQILMINSNEDQIIFTTGNQNKFAIKFWKLCNNNKWQQYQEIGTTDQIISLSLNVLSTKLISAAYHNQICVYENNGSRWSIVQQIDAEYYGCRLCFISQSEFVFLPHGSQNLSLYSSNNKNQNFQKVVNQFQLKNDNQNYPVFPIQFIKSINLLLVINGNFVNILRKQENSTLILDQSIEFKKHKINGCVSEDGQYLLIWDQGSTDLEVRKLNTMQ